MFWFLEDIILLFSKIPTKNIAVDASTDDVVIVIAEGYVLNKCCVTIKYLDSLIIYWIVNDYVGLFISDQIVATVAIFYNPTIAKTYFLKGKQTFC